MATIYTHPGGPYYQWRVLAVGVPPPAVFDTGWPEGVLYAAWQAGQPREAAALAWGLAMTRAGYEGEVPVSLRPQPVAAPAPPTPGVVQTNPGGPYYVWRQQTMGSPPPATFNPDTDCEGKLYHGWQQGLPQFDAKLQYDLCVAARAGQVTGFGELPPAQPAPSPPTEAPIELAGDPAAALAARYGLSGDELQNIGIVMATGRHLGANTLALMTALCIGWGENHWNNTTCNSSDHCGVFQLSSSLQSEHDWHDLSFWADRAFREGFYSYGGIIPMSQRYPTASPGRLANMCQGAYSSLDQGQAYYDQYLQQARDTLAAIAGQGSLPPLGAPAPPSSPATRPAPSEGGVFNLFGALNWAGDFENLWAYVVGGSNEAAHMADVFLAERINQTTVIGWT